MADAVLDMVANPTADSSSKSLSEDSDAVLCVPPLLVQYGRFMLEKPPVAWIVIAPTLPMFLSQLHSAAAKWSGSPLGAIGSGSAAVFPMLAMTVFSFRRVTRAEGQLGLLGLGEVRVSSVAARHLQRWGLAGLVCTAMAVVGGLANAIVKQAVLGLPSDGNPSHVGLTELTSEQRLRSLNLGLFGIFTAPFIFGWWLALKTASLLVSDCVIEARKKVASTSPTDDAWDEFVVPMMLQLLQSTLPALSTGFADGVILAFVTCWILSLGSFCNWLATGIPGMLIGIFTMAMAPLLLAMDVADASSECDNIRSTLNDKRAKNMTIEADAKIQLVERLLQNANRGQGLGFVAGGRVVDRQTLRSIFIALSGGISAILPIIFALRPATSTTGGSSDCMLSTEQSSMIRACTKLALGNATTDACSYNISLEEILRPD